MSSSGPALCSAAAAGDLPRCAELLLAGADAAWPEQPRCRHCTASDLADTARKVDEADVFKRTPLINAVVSGHDACQQTACRRQSAKCWKHVIGGLLEGAGGGSPGRSSR